MDTGLCQGQDRVVGGVAFVLAVAQYHAKLRHCSGKGEVFRKLPGVAAGFYRIGEEGAFIAVGCFVAQADGEKRSTV